MYNRICNYGIHRKKLQFTYFAGQNAGLYVVHRHNFPSVSHTPDLIDRATLLTMKTQMQTGLQ